MLIKKALDRFNSELQPDKSGRQKTMDAACYSALEQLARDLVYLANHQPDCNACITEHEILKACGLVELDP
jgi:hypothetical protein